ncbi:MAG: hypothetical protein QG671_155 [Actinomycetota bacterium]|jgi:excisionase family DNA binding protein|nr:hypothetical protein [Actinomycetota bacterium]
MDQLELATPRRRSATPRHLPSRELLTLDQAADYLNVTGHFIRRLTHERRLPFLKVGRLVRIRRRDLDDFLEGHLVPAVRR